MTLSEFLDRIYIPLRLRGRSHNSVRLLKHAIRQYGIFLRRDAVLEDFDDLTVSQFLAHRGDKLSPYSVERERSGLLALWRLAADRRLVDTRPCVQAELLPERTPRAFSVAELERLYESAQAEPGYIGPVKAAAFFAALVVALFETGERVAAMLAAPKSGWTPPFMKIPAGLRKGRRTERVYELSPECVQLVDQAARHDAETLFLWPLDNATLYHRWARITKRAGLGTGRETKFHAIRKSTASHIAAAGGDACAAMGHGSERTTRRHYLDPRIVSVGRPKMIDSLPKIGAWRTPAS